MRKLIEWAMHYRNIVILLVCGLMAFGVYSLQEMNKNEFPDFTIRQGVVVAAYPGATAEQVEQEVTKPLENYIFTYKEVEKEKTVSYSRPGMAIVKVTLNDELNDKDEFWSKFKHGISTFKSSLPSGVLAVVVQDDFGDTSAMLITLESDDKSYNELNTMMDQLKDHLRTIKSVGRLTTYGMQNEQIAIYLNTERLSHYGLSDQALALQLMQKGFTTTAGTAKSGNYNYPIYVSRSMNTLYDVQQMIVLTDPTTGTSVRLKDVANVVREYPKRTSWIENNGRKCLLLSVEAKSGTNIVKMGEQINTEIDKFQKTLPNSVSIFKITDQSKVVSDSVTNFLRELLIAIVAVIAVVMMLLPLKTALVAASTIPITIFISLGLFYAFGFELNTVTLACLIVTLGMIVDNSIVIIDAYLEKLRDYHQPSDRDIQDVPEEYRREASIESTQHFVKSILSATLAISITFFPMLFTSHGMIHDFLQTFPWGVTIILMTSLLVAILLVPFMQYYFIRRPIKERKAERSASGKPRHRHRSFMDVLQQTYNRLIQFCFRWPKSTLAVGITSVLVGILLIQVLPQKMMPVADRDQFAVEITLPTGTSVDHTAVIADSLMHVLQRDRRVVSVATLKGCSSPRFHNAYAPQMAGENFAQFIVNTTGPEATVEVLDQYTPEWSNKFPEALVRFKQLAYNEAEYPIEVRISCDSLKQLQQASDSLISALRQLPELYQVTSNLGEQQTGLHIHLHEDEASRLGITNFNVETTMAMRYGTGLPVINEWEGDTAIPVVLKSQHADEAQPAEVSDEQIPVLGGLANVPLRQIADIDMQNGIGQITHRNGIRTVTIHAEVQRGLNVNNVFKKVQHISTPLVNRLNADSTFLGEAEPLRIEYGGDYEFTNDIIPQVAGGVAVAVVIIFLILLWHYKCISTALMLFFSLTLTLFGATMGVLIQQVDFSVTCFLGIISLMGILVRNGIIMIDYTNELLDNGENVRDACIRAAERRMRPIFLTSAAASMGVIPMILGKSGLWMPMGCVIFWGTLITMLFILTVIPVTYYLIKNTANK